MGKISETLAIILGILLILVTIFFWTKWIYNEAFDYGLELGRVEPYWEAEKSCCERYLNTYNPNKND